MTTITNDASLEEGNNDSTTNFTEEERANEDAFNKAADSAMARMRKEPTAQDPAAAPAMPAAPAAPAGTTAPSPADKWASAPDDLRQEYETLAENAKRYQGTIAGLHRKVDDLSKQSAAKSGDAAQPISKGKAKAILDAYAEDFPESAEFLAKFGDALADELRAESAANLGEVTSAVEPMRVEAAKRAWDNGLNQIKAAHSDFDEVRASPAFRVFQDNLPPGTLDAAGATPEGTIKMLTAFKAFRPENFQQQASDNGTSIDSPQGASNFDESISAARRAKLALAENLPTTPGSRDASEPKGDALFNAYADKLMAKNAIAMGRR